MKKIIIVLIILVGNFVNLYYMGQNVEKESEQDLTVANFENVQSENSIIEEKQEVLNIVDDIIAINMTKKPGFELVTKGYLCQLWFKLYERISDTQFSEKPAVTLSVVPSKPPGYHSSAEKLPTALPI